MEHSAFGEQPEQSTNPDQMDNKVPQNIYSRVRQKSLGSDAAHIYIWAIINSGQCGMTSSDPKLAAFECGVQTENMDAVMLAMDSIKTPSGWWLPDFMSREFGTGEKMADNSMMAGAFKEMAMFDHDTQELILSHYPQLRVKFTRFLETGKFEKPKKKNPKPEEPYPQPPQPKVSSIKELESAADAEW